MNETLEWIAVVLTVSAAICTSMDHTPLNIWLFNAASIFWVIHSYRVNRSALLVTNVSLLLIYSIGVFRNL